jgi:hypothetical protein
MRSTVGVRIHRLGQFVKCQNVGAAAAVTDLIGPLLPIRAKAAF